MSTIHSGPADAPDVATDTGEWRSQQGVVLGYVAVLEQIMAQMAEFYTPEYEVNGQRLTTVWRRGGTPGNPIVIAEDPALQPNWFVGEQYKSLNYAPQSIHFFRSPGTHQISPTPMIGNHRTGYRQLYNLIYSITTRITSFDDDDGQELFNFLVAATYRQTHGSVLNAVGESLTYLPKMEDSRGTTMEFQIKVGLPIFEPPLTPACVQSALVNTEISHGPKC
jgi:hypothetical protein